MDKVAVLIPCYNEAPTVEKVVKDFIKATASYDGKVYVYNNNSTDGTAELAEKAGAIVRHEFKQGKGNVIRRMFREIDARCYVLVDGDNTYSAEDAPEMIKKVLHKNADMVVGDRLSSSYYTENKRPYHNTGNDFVRNSINWIFKSDVKDVMTGYRALSTNFVKSFPVLSKGFEIETEMTIHAIDKDLSLENVVIQYKDRPEGSVSKLDTFKDGMKVIGTIIRLFRNYRPLKFFGYLALTLCIIATVFFAPVLAEFISTGMVRRFPTLIVCGFIGIAAVQSFFTGLMLETIRQKNLQDFELDLLKSESKYRDK